MVVVSGFVMIGGFGGLIDDLIRDSMVMEVIRG